MNYGPIGTWTWQLPILSMNTWANPSSYCTLLDEQGENKYLSMRRFKLFPGVNNTMETSEFLTDSWQKSCNQNHGSNCDVMKSTVTIDLIKDYDSIVVIGTKGLDRSKTANTASEKYDGLPPNVLAIE